MKSKKFKVGDRVRVLDNIPRRWWFKPGYEGVVVDNSRPTTLHEYEIKFDSHSGVSGKSVGFVDAKHIELIEPAAKFVIMLKKGGLFLPSEEPRVYLTEKQAYHVAKAMSKKHGGRFVVFKAVGEAFSPEVEPEVKEYK